MKKGSKVSTIPSYSFEDTTDPDIKRFVDRNGDWTHYWIVSEKRFVKAVNHVLSLGYNKGPRFRQYLLSTTVEKAAEKLLETGDEGTRTHRAIGDLIKGLRITMTTKYPSELSNGRQDALNDEEWTNLEAWMNWCETYNPRFVAIDMTVRGDDFAGTFDAFLVITVPSGDKNFVKQYWGKDVLVLVDWKTSAGIWFEYESQLAAYWQGILRGRVYDAYIKAYKGQVFSAVVRLGTKHRSGWEMEIFPQQQTEKENWYRFNAAVKIANRYETEFAPVIDQIPTQFFIKIPKAKVPAGKRIKKV